MNSSCAQIRGIESKCICAFDKDSSKILVVCADGTFLTYNFEDKQGECQRLSNKRFVKDPGELPDNVITNSTTPMSATQQQQPGLLSSSSSSSSSSSPSPSTEAGKSAPSTSTEPLIPSPDRDTSH